MVYYRSVNGLVFLRIIVDATVRVPVSLKRSKTIEWAERSVQTLHLLPSR